MKNSLQWRPNVLLEVLAHTLFPLVFMTLLQTGIITSGFRQDTRDNVLTAAELRR